MLPVTVRNQAELSAALRTIEGGGIVLLAPGEWPSIAITGINPTQPVTITNADPAKPALVRRLVVDRSKSLTFSGLRISRAKTAAEPAWSRMAEVTSCSDISFVGGSISGSLDGDPTNDMSGLYVRAVVRPMLMGMTLRQLNVASAFEDCTDATIQGNSFTEISGDGIDIPGMRGARIAWNSFTKFRPGASAHPDAIQCWTRGKGSGCKDVTISGNLIECDPGYETQGVFFGDEDGVGGYDRITIEMNRMRGTMWHAINVGPGDGQMIRGNDIAGGPKISPWIRTASPAVIIGNTAPSFFLQNVQCVPPGNLLV